MGEGKVVGMRDKEKKRKERTSWVQLLTSVIPAVWEGGGRSVVVLAGLSNCTV